MSPFAAVARRRDALCEAARRVVSDLSPSAPLSAEVIDRVVDAVHPLLPARVPRGPVVRSFLPLVGVPYDAARVRTVAWAVAADAARLRAGAAVVPGALVPGTRVLVQVTAARAVHPQGGEPGVRFKGRVLVGPGAPADAAWGWSNRFCAFQAVHPIGFGYDRKYRGRPLTYRSPLTLVGMRFAATVEPLDSRTGRPRVTFAGCPPAARAHNRALIGLRARTEFPCPFAFTHQCHACPKGQASCPAAVRARDLAPEPCARCKRAFDRDPDWPPVCAACLNSRKKN